MQNSGTPAYTSGTLPCEEDVPVDQRPYQKIVGSLLFLSTRTRPDISAAVNLLCRHCSAPNTSNLVAAKRVLRHLQGTRNSALRFLGQQGTLVALADADWGGDQADRKSTSGILLQYAGCSVLLKSSKKTSVALSTTEAEYLATSEACKSVTWMRAILTDFYVKLDGPTRILEDNQSAIT